MRRLIPRASRNLLRSPNSPAHDFPEQCPLWTRWWIKPGNKQAKVKDVSRNKWYWDCHEDVPRHQEKPTTTNLGGMVADGIGWPSLEKNVNNLVQHRHYFHRNSRKNRLWMNGREWNGMEWMEWMEWNGWMEWMIWTEEGMEHGMEWNGPNESDAYMHALRWCLKSISWNKAQMLLYWYKSPVKMVWPYCSSVKSHLVPILMFSARDDQKISILFEFEADDYR